MATVAPLESREAFAQRIMKEHRQDLLSFLAWRGIPERDREDLFQEVAHAACDARERRDPARSLRAWLRGIARNLVTHHLQRPYVREEQLTGEDADTACHVGPGLEEILVHRDRLAMLAQMLESMPEPERRAFVLHRIKGLPLDEVAEAEGINPSTAASRVRRGDEHCQAWLERWKATERRKGRDGRAVVLIPLLDQMETARRDSAPSRLAGLWGRVLMRGAVALLALGCMSPASREVLTLEPIVAIDVGALSMAAPSVSAPEPLPSAAPITAPTPEPEPPSTLTPEAAPTPSASRALTARQRKAAEIMVLLAEAEHNAGNDAAALRLLLEHGERGPGGKAAEKRSKLLRKINSR